MFPRIHIIKEKCIIHYDTRLIVLSSASSPVSITVHNTKVSDRTKNTLKISSGVKIVRKRHGVRARTRDLYMHLTEFVSNIFSDKLLNFNIITIYMHLFCVV